MARAGAWSRRGVDAAHVDSSPRDEFGCPRPFDVVLNANVNRGDATMCVAIVNKTVLVTGANRGLGRALVDEALRRGAKRVYAASRRPLVVRDQRVTPLILDVTADAQIQEAAHGVESLDILIN